MKQLDNMLDQRHFIKPNLRNKMVIGNKLNKVQPWQLLKGIYPIYLKTMKSKKFMISFWETLNQIVFRQDIIYGIKKNYRKADRYFVIVNCLIELSLYINLQNWDNL